MEANEKALFRNLSKMLTEYTFIFRLMIHFGKVKSKKKMRTSENTIIKTTGYPVQKTPWLLAHNFPLHSAKTRLSLIRSKKF